MGLWHEAVCHHSEMADEENPDVGHQNSDQGYHNNTHLSVDRP